MGGGDKDEDGAGRGEEEASVGAGDDVEGAGGPLVANSRLELVVNHLFNPCASPQV